MEAVPLLLVRIPTMSAHFVITAPRVTPHARRRTGPHKGDMLPTLDNWCSRVDNCKWVYNTVQAVTTHTQGHWSKLGDSCNLGTPAFVCTYLYFVRLCGAFARRAPAARVGVVSPCGAGSFLCLALSGAGCLPACILRRK